MFVVTVATSAAMLVCGATPDRPLPPDHVQQRDIAHVRTVADGAAPDLPSSGLSAPSLVDGNTSIVESARDLVYRLERERVTLRKRMLVVVISCAGASAAQFVVAHFDWRSLPWRTLAFGHVTGLLGDIVYGKPPVMTAALMVATLGTSRKASHHWRHTWSKVLRQLDADERNSTGMPLEEDRRSQARLQKLTLTVNADFASRFGYSLDDVFASGTRLRWLTQAIKCGFVHHPTIENHLIGNVLHLLLQCTFTEKLHGSQRMLLMHISSILGGAFAHVLVAQRTGNSSREMVRCRPPLQGTLSLAFAFTVSLLGSGDSASGRRVRHTDTPERSSQRQLPARCPVRSRISAYACFFSRHRCSPVWWSVQLKR